MSRLKSLLLATAVAAFATQSHAGPEPVVVVVVNPASAISSMTKAQLSVLYKGGTRHFPDGSRAAPVNLPFESSSRLDFDRAVLNMSPDQVKRFWIDMKIRSGVVPPRQLPADAAVARHVARSPEGVGYLNEADAKGLKIVARIVGGKLIAP